MSTTACAGDMMNGRNAIATRPTPNPASPNTKCEARITTAPTSHAGSTRGDYRHTDCWINDRLLETACKLYEGIMQLDSLIDRLADFAPTTAPVISLYLDGRPDQHGRERYGVFVRKELAARVRAWHERSPERDSFHRDVDRILAWLHEEARPSANGLAIFACAGADFFEALQLD